MPNCNGPTLDPNDVVTGAAVAAEFIDPNPNAGFGTSVVPVVVGTPKLNVDFVASTVVIPNEGADFGISATVLGGY